ncbi:TPA: ATP-dependent Clp protease ATP-binding subunit ClpX [Clostridioides difficile]|uniref:ATP-dependent Clp protease ATP-binding subunit ClpX n=1 Tax=Clostridioides difficile TaxID=1496 RepID=UPI000BB1C017|nr:ATP-dependent Clp protease ATP-binding subunit ClpX [Clostridioides difficile]MBY1346179.1 ATP-dependent Clp protease ATP-binding subunit ClpX [Clostridioides difficile]MDI2978664.1 ATP-dependent Clp protease ATP-binding subunit ClpX [Clostridioides difficile]MDI6151665.1 ATP-dependent Clp protease ATP-binding subunit ClpX [Clostridioides difficile]MDI7828016.1 ATP-dependent Clp protease ATP-binding subunit ClpX [Clostridioides difficile]MDU8821071.1 ATP-dependent Clp protease ATP-binding s
MKKMCNWCGNRKDENEMEETKAGDFICLSCKEKTEDVIEHLRKNIKKPIDIIEYMNKFIIGQDKAKKMIATTIYNHYLSIINNVNVEKNNILLTGASGTGKTLIAKTLANFLDVPFVVADSNTLTEAGYIGKDVESIIASLYNKSNKNINKTKYGIVFLDEIDKLAKNNITYKNQVGKEGVQQALLKLIEGTICKIQDDVTKNYVEIDTTNILFICGGAFVGIEDIIKERLHKKTIGFKSNLNEISLAKDEVRKNINIDDLYNFGMIPEFLGRFPVICNLETLDLEKVKLILKSDQGLIGDYNKLFKLQNKELEFTEDALSLIANLAIEENVLMLGARGLKTFLSPFMTELMFYASSDNESKYLITEEKVKNFF